MNKKSFLRSGLALVLALCMVLSLCPVGAKAAEVESIQKLLAILEKNGLELNNSDITSGSGIYYPTEESYYVALGDDSAKDGYPVKLAEELGVTLKDLIKDLEKTGKQTLEAQLKEVKKAVTKRHIQQADLVSIGFGNVTCVNEAINGVLGSGAAVDWSKYVAAEDVPQIQQIIQELVVEVTGKSSDMIEGALDAFAFSFVSYIYGMTELIDTVHSINPEALVLVVGMHNPLKGVVFEMSGIKLDISDSLGDLVQAANSHIAGYCASIENVVFVNAPDVATINTKSNMGMMDMLGLLNNECADFNPSDAGHTYIKDRMMDALVISEPQQPAVNGVTRLAGETRYETSMKIADEMKTVLGVEKFDSIILASSEGFADALAGSYLAAVKEAPIIIGKEKYKGIVCDYVNANLAENGTVYVLGGEGAVPEAMLAGITVTTDIQRLAGNDRYTTNLEILDAAGIGTKDLLVATGQDFADSLSASATGLPILLVNGKPGKTLSEEQKGFLADVTGNIYIIGGESAVPASMVEQIEAASGKKTERVAGGSRYETSVKIAEKFLADAESAVVAYASTFPDGLCGGPLAYTVGAPLILTKDGKSEAPDYTKANGITSGYVLGGEGLISDGFAKQIFGVEEILK